MSVSKHHDSWVMSDHRKFPCHWNFPCHRKFPCHWNFLWWLIFCFSPSPRALAWLAVRGTSVTHCTALVQYHRYFPIICTYISLLYFSSILSLSCLSSTLDILSSSACTAVITVVSDLLNNHCSKGPPRIPPPTQWPVESPVRLTSSGNAWTRERTQENEPKRTRQHVQPQTKRSHSRESNSRILPARNAHHQVLVNWTPTFIALVVPDFFPFICSQSRLTPDCLPISDCWM